MTVKRLDVRTCGWSCIIKLDEMYVEEKQTLHGAPRPSDPLRGQGVHLGEGLKVTDTCRNAHCYKTLQTSYRRLGLITQVNWYSPLSPNYSQLDGTIIISNKVVRSVKIGLGVFYNLVYYQSHMYFGSKYIHEKWFRKMNPNFRFRQQPHPKSHFNLLQINKSKYFDSYGWIDVKLN